MKKIVEYIPIISALLLFVGFINYISYYRFFDIEIIHYLTSGEMLLSFLPLTFPILFLVSLLTLFFILENIPLPGDAGEKVASAYTKSFFSVFSAYEVFTSIKEIWKNRKPTKLKWLLGLFFLLLLFIIGILFIIYFIVGLFMVPSLAISQELFPDWSRGDVMILSLLWFLFLLDIISKAEKKGKIRKTEWINLFIVLLAFIFFVSLSNRMNATDILSGKPKYEVKFEFQGTVVQTDSNFVYVGRTTNHIFLRDLQSKVNSIYQADKIQHLEITKK